MTAPAVTPPAATAAVDLNDDALVAAAIGARVERSQHLFPDDPAEIAADPAPVDAPAKADPTPDASATPADSTTPAGSTDGAADPTPPVDHFGTLLTSAKPLTYKVNGTDRTFDGIVELPDGKGALIPPDKVAELRNLVSRYDSNAEAYREYRGKVDAYEQRFGGMDGITAKLEVAAQTNAAAFKVLDALRTDPTQFVMVVDNKIVPNPEAIQWLTRSAALEAREAKWQARQEWEQTAQTAQRTTSEAEVRQTAVPSYLNAQHADLHAEDRAFLERRASQYLFVATKETAPHYGVPEGTVMLAHEDLNADIAHLKGLRSKAAETQTASAAAVKAAEKAAAENARRNPAPVVVPKKAPSLPRDKETGQWTRPERLSPAEIIDRSLAGLPIGGRAQLTE